MLDEKRYCLGAVYRYQFFAEWFWQSNHIAPLIGYMFAYQKYKNAKGFFCQFFVRLEKPDGKHHIYIVESCFESQILGQFCSHRKSSFLFITFECPQS
ncbi:MAG: hypothetical protein QM530_08725 [Phycisphaerales bacterium]|nr:hypothetical protein [Phycisphaerales bacterium]